MNKKYPPKKPDKSHLIKAHVKHEWSDFQKSLFKDLAKGAGNTIVIARAGSAKSSSLVEGSRYIPKGKKTLFCAFNKSIQEELSQKLGSYVNCSTLHSLGFRAIKSRFGPNIELDNYKCWNLVEDIVGKENDGLIDNICKTVGFCKSNLVDTPSKIEELILEYGIDLCDVKIDEFIKHVCLTLRKCKEQTAIIDFNDMIWLCFVYGIKPYPYDIVMIDEAQDMSKCMIELALSACKKDGRIFAVLDPRQAIYDFMGADSRVLDNLRNRLNPKELSLPICYRCPTKVIDLLKIIVPDIQAADNAKEGEIIDLFVSDLQKHAKPGDYVLSRFNAPLIKHCFQFIKKGIPSNILGRDIGEGLNYLVKKSKKKSIKELLKWIDTWEKEEKERYLQKYPKANTDIISDKADCIRMLCEDISTIDEIKENIKKMFSDGEESKVVLFSSIHKNKGKQAKNVFVLTDTLRVSDETEINLNYVAFSRSMDKLYLVSKDNKNNLEYITKKLKNAADLDTLNLED